tara:strand:- start:433 stop:1293 length:861 start_codon:yes stop_codon:yes gene_type:complete
VTNKSPNELLNIPRDASPEEIAAAVTARTSHLRNLSEPQSQQSLAEIYQAAAFLMWEAANNEKARTASGQITNAGPTNSRIQAHNNSTTTKKRRRKKRKPFAPLAIIVPTLATVSAFILYPDKTISTAWSIIDQATNYTAQATIQPTSIVLPPTELPDPISTPFIFSAPASQSNIIAAPESDSDIEAIDFIDNNDSQPQLEACVTISSLNVRSGPSSSYNKITYLLEGECVTLIALNQAGTWGKIKDIPGFNSTLGWISLTYVDYDITAPLPISEASQIIDDDNSN